MQNIRPGPATPAYPVDAVDNTLRALTMLDRSEAVGVSEVARELGVSRSTAHRLLRMLVFRGFAAQRDDRAYVAGPTFTRASQRRNPAVLCSTLRPVLETIHADLGETVHLVVREGTSALFLDSIEAAQPLRVSSRAGMRLPAEITSGGKALLAQLPATGVRGLYGHREGFDIRRLERVLTSTRQQGYGLNVGESEAGISAVGVCVPEAGAVPIAAITVSAPTLRFNRARARQAAAQLTEALRRFTPSSGH